MPFCPQCRYEYREGLKICPECDVKLVDELEPPSSSQLVDKPEPPGSSQEAPVLVKSVKGAFIGNLILLVIASLISQGVESLPALAPAFRVIALIIGIPLALGAIVFMFSAFVSNTREEALSSQLALTIIACLPMGLLGGLYSDKIPPTRGFVGSILGFLEFVFIGTWIIATGISLMKAVVAPWWHGVMEESKRVFQESLQQDGVEEQKVENPKPPPWAFLSEEQIKEYLKAHGLRIDATKYAPAKKTYGIVGGLLTAPLTLGLGDRLWNGVCPHCGWGISAAHAIGAFRALTQCNNCGKLALLDRNAERFLAVVPEESGL